MSARKTYSSNARFIEIAPPGIAFRALLNVDRINLVRFENKIEMLPADTNSEDKNVEDVPRIVGYKVIVGVDTQNNEFTFAQPQVAVHFYNEILDSIGRVGAPMDKKPSMELVMKSEPDKEDKESFESAQSSPPLLDSRGRPVMPANDGDVAVPGEEPADEGDNESTQH